MLDARAYYDFVMKLVLAVGVGFVLPVFLVLLNFTGVISGVAIIRGWRFAVLAVFVFTAITTPAADIASMFLLALPMLALYLAAAGVSILHDRRSTRALADDLAETAS
jgi:sec-independent protein translocase protein TatC